MTISVALSLSIGLLIIMIMVAIYNQICIFLTNALKSYNPITLVQIQSAPISSSRILMT